MAFRGVPKKGRGVFCTQDIPQGTTICEDLDGSFHTESQWREFLGLLPPELALDCVDWACVDRLSDGRLVLCMDFNDSALLNHGSLKDGKANIKGEVDEEDGELYMVATRYIAAGEELLCDYTLTGVGYNHNLTWFTEIHQEYYPGVPIDETELESFV